MTDWDAPETLALLGLLIGIALGTLSGYTVALERYPYTVDYDPSTDPGRHHQPSSPR